MQTFKWDCLFSVLENLLLVIDVVQEKIKRRAALNKPAFQKLPLPGRNDARHEVEREDPLGAARIAIHIERHTLAQERQVKCVSLRSKLIRRQSRKGVPQSLIMRQDAARGVEHLIEKSIYTVIRKQRTCRLSFGQRGHFASGPNHELPSFVFRICPLCAGSPIQFLLEA
jgi:hypothetical protein